ncbi:hypothetical protein CAAN1_02S00122 [[Candida] anglica]|uniref:Uncharacterized protein n=1 Tax=[Candida] anglica TaxID=148631 RepID=A0ABP0E808_9ASCO
MSLRFKQVDVFTSKRYKGNAVAVFFDADDLDQEQMQQIANWTNLAETTFVLKPTDPKADYRLRIFTPGCELPFAGHPTLGSCHAIYESGLISPRNGQFIQECEGGLVTISLENDILSFQLPYNRTSEVTESNHKDIADALGVNIESITSYSPPIAIDVGPKWLTIKFPDAQAVIGLNPDLQKITKLSSKLQLTGIQTFGEYEDGSLESRTFAPIVGLNEDFACGSGSGAIGTFIHKFGNTEITRFKVKQGRRVGRDAELNIRIDGDKIHVGGSSITCLEGTYQI